MLRILVVFFIAIFHFHVDGSTEKKTICLNMIVKNESKVIERCLASVKPIIDYWVIVDTGSSDKTQEIIKNFMKDIPGELHERPWVNFGHNRSEALVFAKGKGDYILIIDADEVLEYDPNFSLPQLDKDFYYITTSYGGTAYGRVQLINNHIDWKWNGVLHEYLHSDQARTQDTVLGVKDIVRMEGSRSSDPEKYRKDAKILEEALKENPNNTRDVFYLAQSYRDAQDFEMALKNYERRIAMGGWDQEVFWSMLQAAIMQEDLAMPPQTVIDSYYRAFNYRHTRMEPLYRIANHYRRAGKYAEGYIVALAGSNIPLSNDVLFVEKWIYDYGMLLELSICAYWMGKYEECRDISQRILANSSLPGNVRDCVQRNLAFANEKLPKTLVQLKP